MPPGALRYCRNKCRQAAYRARRNSKIEGADGTPRRIAIADPPYLGLAKRYYGNEPTFAGEVDHARLLDILQTYDGWALACSRRSLRTLLPMSPEGSDVAVWGKPHGAAPATRGAHNCWEAVIYKPARRLRPGIRDFLVTATARGGGTLIGRKPIAWCKWVFRLVGAQPGDSLDDLFPGTGVVSSVWRQLYASPAALADEQGAPTP